MWLPLRSNWVLLFFAIAAACSSQHDDDMDAEMPPAETIPRDAGTLDASTAKEPPAEQGIDPDAIYVIGECPRRAVDSSFAITWPVPGGCERSADCIAEPYGVCLGYERPTLGEVGAARCHYEECIVDGQCPTSRRCRCGFDGVRRCVKVDCETDDDCGVGRKCERTQLTCSDQNGQNGDYFCTRPDDECVTNEDCRHTGRGQSCIFDDTMRRYCLHHTCE